MFFVCSMLLLRIHQKLQNESEKKSYSSEKYRYSKIIDKRYQNDSNPSIWSVSRRSIFHNNINFNRCTDNYTYSLQVAQTSGYTFVSNDKFVK